MHADSHSAGKGIIQYAFILVGSIEMTRSERKERWNDVQQRSPTQAQTNQGASTNSIL